MRCQGVSLTDTMGGGCGGGSVVAHDVCTRISPAMTSTDATTGAQAVSSVTSGSTLRHMKDSSYLTHRTFLRVHGLDAHISRHKISLWDDMAAHQLARLVLTSG